MLTKHQPTFEYDQCLFVKSALQIVFCSILSVNIQNMGAIMTWKCVVFAGLFLVGYSPARAACFGYNNGTCYRVEGSASALNSPPYYGSYNYLDSVAEGHLDFSYLSNKASSDVSLDDASIRLFAEAQVAGSGASAYGGFTDTVKFELPNGVVSVVIPISFIIDGVNIHYSGASYNNISFNFQMASYYLPGADPTHFDVSSVTKACGFDSDFTLAICKAGSVSFGFSDTITIWDDVVYQVGINFSIGGSGIAQDYKNTGKFTWALPPGVTYQSASGVFLADALPEPLQWVFMSVGFAAIGTVMRRNTYNALRI